MENAIRPTAIGKKNWLFIGGAQAGERSAILYTIVESCRQREIDPARYLRAVLTALPTMTNWQVKDWTPEAWAKAQRSAHKAAERHKRRSSIATTSTTAPEICRACQQALRLTLTFGELRLRYDRNRTQITLGYDSIQPL